LLEILLNNEKAKQNKTLSDKKKPKAPETVIVSIIIPIQLYYIK